jgi:hypothetical protein
MAVGQIEQTLPFANKADVEFCQAIEMSTAASSPLPTSIVYRGERTMK